LGGVLLYIAQKKESDWIMSTKPSIIVTRLDVQRLERLIDSLDEKMQESPGVLALQDELDRADQVGHEEIPAGVVTMNSRVHCREEASGKDYHLTLVYPKDANADEGKISILAPIGSALLGLSVGEQIDWPAPGGKTLKLKLLEVEYQPEAAGNYDL